MIRTVLIIEDDHDIRVALRQVFEAADYLVLTVTNGLQAFDLLKITKAPDLIICDLNMPFMDGETFIKKKAVEPKIKDVPVIIISAHQQKFCQLPGITCMPKPLDIFQLIKSAKDAISSSGTNKGIDS